MPKGGYKPNGGRPRMKPLPDPNAPKRGRGRPRKDGVLIPPQVKAENAEKIKEVVEKVMQDIPEHKEAYKKLTPLEYALEVMNDPSIDEMRRDRMAIAALPFMHPKKGEIGKREADVDNAKVASKGKFSPAPAPKLVVNNK